MGDSDVSTVSMGRRESDSEGVVVPKAVIGPAFALLLSLAAVFVAWGDIQSTVATIDSNLTAHVEDPSRHYSSSTLETRITRNEQDIQRILRTLETELAELRREVRNVSRAVGAEP